MFFQGFLTLQLPPNPDNADFAPQFILHCLDTTKRAKMSNPFECNICKKRVHGRNINDLKCCEGAKFQALVKICLLVPKKELPENTIVHTSPASFDGKPVPAGVEWVTMCNLPSLMTRQGQRVVTRYPGAVTCETCLAKYEEKIKQLEEEEYQNNIEYIDN